jgi:energy-coupling factor transporter ATP-binding protein EcfA2
LKISKIKIINILSFDKTEIHLENYNVIVGPNSSGKTNLVRILKFLKTSSEGPMLHGIDEKRISPKMKLYKNRASYIKIDIILSEQETRILLQFLFNRRIDGTLGNKLREISLVIGWENVYDDDISPDYLLIHFANGFTIWREHSSDVWSYMDGIPEGSEELSVAIQDMIKIPADIEKREEYQREKKLSAIYMPSHENFQHDFIHEQSIQHFFQLGEKIITVASDFHMAYDRRIDNKQKKHTIDVFQFVGIPISTGSISLWLLIQSFINKMTVQSEQHPGIPDLASELHLFKDREDKREKYKSICNEFSKLFPNISFDTFSSDEKEYINEESSKYVIKITEELPGMESLCSFNLDDSASGYFEALYLLYEKWRYEDHILILDEPAVRIHPNVIRHLGRILSTSNRQMILVTHSPYFVDVSMMGGSKRLIYFKRGNITTEVGRLKNSDQKLYF